MSTIVDRRGVTVDDDASTGVDYQEVTGASDTIEGTVRTVVVNRTGPTLTELRMPDASVHVGRKLRIRDYSQSVTAHTIRLTPWQASQKLARNATYDMRSNAAALADRDWQVIVDPDDSTNYVWI